MQEAWWRKWARIGVSLLIAIPAAVLATMLEEVDIANAYVKMIFAGIIPTLVLGFGFFFLTDFANRRVGLLTMQQSNSANSALLILNSGDSEVKLEFEGKKTHEHEGSLRSNTSSVNGNDYDDDNDGARY